MISIEDVETKKEESMFFHNRSQTDRKPIERTQLAVEKHSSYPDPSHCSIKSSQNSLVRDDIGDMFRALKSEQLERKPSLDGKKKEDEPVELPRLDNPKFD